VKLGDRDVQSGAGRISTPMSHGRSRLRDEKIPAMKKEGER
jgi:hypothetical protein